MTRLTGSFTPFSQKEDHATPLAIHPTKRIHWSNPPSHRFSEPNRATLIWPVTTTRSVIAANWMANRVGHSLSSGLQSRIFCKASRRGENATNGIRKNRGKKVSYANRLINIDARLATNQSRGLLLACRADRTQQYRARKKNMQAILA